MDLSVNKKPLLHHLSSLKLNMRLIILNVRLDTIKLKSGCVYFYRIFSFDPVLSCTSRIEVWSIFSFVWLVCQSAYSKNNHSSVPKHPSGKFLTHQKFWSAKAGSSIAEIVLGVDSPSKYLFFPTVVDVANAVAPHCMKLPTIKVAGLSPVPSEKWTTQNCLHLLGHARVNICRCFFFRDISALRTAQMTQGILHLPS